MSDLASGIQNPEDLNDVDDFESGLEELSTEDKNILSKLQTPWKYLTCNFDPKLHRDVKQTICCAMMQLDLFGHVQQFNTLEKEAVCEVLVVGSKENISKFPVVVRKMFPSLKLKPLSVDFQPTLSQKVRILKSVRKEAQQLPDTGTLNTENTSAPDTSLSQSVMSARSAHSSASKVSSGQDDRTFIDLSHFHPEIVDRVKYSVASSSPRNESYAGSLVSSISSVASSAISSGAEQLRKRLGVKSLDPYIQSAVEKYVGLKIERDLNVNVVLTFHCDGEASEQMLHSLQFSAACSWEESLRELIDENYLPKTCRLEKVMLKRLNEDGTDKGWIKATQPAVLMKVDAKTEPCLQVYLKTPKHGPVPGVKQHDA